MEFITLNGKRYMGLGEFNHMRRNLIRDIYDRYARGDDGQYHLSPEDMGAAGAYHHIMVEVLGDELHEANVTAKNAEELRANHDRIYDAIKAEYIDGRYLIVGNDDNGKVYFRKMCPYVPKDDAPEEEPEYDDTPVFTSMLRLAKTWTDHYQAEGFKAYLADRTGMDNLKVVPAWVEYMSPSDKKKLLDAIFRDDKEEDDAE